MPKNKYVPPPDAKLWERMRGEGQRSWEYFQVYRDLGRARSLRITAERCGKAKQYIEKLSVDNHWVERVGAWDAEVDRQTQQAQIDAIREMRKRHAELAYGMIEKAFETLSGMDASEIRPSDLSRLVEVATKLERLALGDTGDVIEERRGESPAPVVQFYMPDNHRDEHEE